MLMPSVQGQEQHLPMLKLMVGFQHPQEMPSRDFREDGAQGAGFPPYSHHCNKTKRWLEMAQWIGAPAGETAPWLGAQAALAEDPYPSVTPVPGDPTPSSGVYGALLVCGAQIHIQHKT